MPKPIQLLTVRELEDHLCFDAPSILRGQYALERGWTENRHRQFKNWRSR